MRLKHIFVQKRKLFDHTLQQAKRRYWIKLQDSLLCEYKHDSRYFWQRIGKIGISNGRKQKIPMEIVNTDGLVSNNHKDVLDRWRTDYVGLFSADALSDKIFDLDFYDDAMAELSRHDMPYPHTEPLMLESDIVESEVKRAVKRAKIRKATGYDKIHAELLKMKRLLGF